MNEDKAEWLAAEYVRRLRALNSRTLDVARDVALALLCEEVPDALAGDLRRYIVLHTSVLPDGSLELDFVAILGELESAS